MNKFNPEKLTIEYRDSVTYTEPLLSRKYTFTHTDDTGELLLTIGREFAWDTVNPILRDEVLGEWITDGVFLYFHIYVFVALNKHDFETALKRNEIFRRELPLALMAIHYGDRFLFDQYPHLQHVFILVHFISTDPSLANQEIWGTFSHFPYSNGIKQH